VAATECGETEIQVATAMGIGVFVRARRGEYSAEMENQPS